VICIYVYTHVCSRYTCFIIISRVGRARVQNATCCGAAEGELTHRALTYAHTMACAQWTGRERGGGGAKGKKKRLRGNVARRICCSLRTANLSKNSPGLRATYTNIIYILYFVYIINVGRKSIASVSVSRVIIIIRDRSPCRDNRGDASSSRDDNNVLHVRVAAWPGRPRRSGRDDRRRYAAEAGRVFSNVFIFFPPRTLLAGRPEQHVLQY